MIKEKETNKKLDLPVYLFHQGTNYRAYDLMGCHFDFDPEKGIYTYVFRVFAPMADNVRVVGDFCSWDNGIQMEKISYGIWQAEYKSERPFEGSYYKYAVTRNGTTHYKADPYAFSSQTHTKTASVIKSLDNLRFDEGNWEKIRHRAFSGRSKKAKSHFYPSPLNIYEVHLGSFKTRGGESTADGEHYLNYRELADQLVPYVKGMGYTHVELLPIMEHPFDGSWGYQVCGYYAPTSRFGCPEDFAYFVSKLHKNGVGVILDWVPAHFPKDEHGLFEFDGGPLYEYSDKSRMENAGWGTRFFDVGKPEVQSFLISNAMFWLGKYHVDGLRVDAVASMLYLDYDKKPGEWTPNCFGGNQNLETVDFFKKLNSAVFAEFPDALMIAEESTAWPMITKPVSDGGLGFNFKWNMGFSNDMFEYVSMDPIGRQYNQSKLTFPMMYAFSENYILPVSHDEVVHGKKSLIDKMFGSYEEKFSMMRAFFVYMMTMPGKKLSFMGNEYAQFREWDYQNQLEWFMLDFPMHSKMQKFVRVLNNLYLSSPQLWEIDDSWDGFKWLEADRAEDNAVIYERIDALGKSYTVIVHFSPVQRKSYEFPVDRPGKYRVVLNSDLEEFGGSSFLKDELITVSEGEKSGSCLLRFDLPGYCGLILERTE